MCGRRQHTLSIIRLAFVVVTASSVQDSRSRPLMLL